MEGGAGVESRAELGRELPGRGVALGAAVSRDNEGEMGKDRGVSPVGGSWEGSSDAAWSMAGQEVSSKTAWRER